MPRCARSAAAILSLLLLVNFSPASGARPLLDLHKWDAYFALYAHDSNVPWAPAAVRLDTYSGAPVDFAAYEVDPEDVIVAGNAPARSIPIRRARRVAQWRFLPAGGYQFRSSLVPIPLVRREGFFVIEARRANVAVQVWVNQTRVGLVSKESPGELLLYGADLETGHPLAHMRVSLLRSGSFVIRFTDAHGILRVHEHPRPVFALAEWGSNRAFLSLLPQPPLPAAVAGIALESATVHAGDDLKVTGFARTRLRQGFRSARGAATLSLRYRGAVVSTASVPLDEAGSFATALRVPPQSAAGEYNVLLDAAGASAGASVHVDADSGGFGLQVDSPCMQVCDPSSGVPLTVTARRDGKPAPNELVHLRVVRSPHIRTEGDLRGDEWGNTVVADTNVTTGLNGTATLPLAAPTDGLSSTYGVTARHGGATAATRVIVPTADVVLSLRLDGSTFAVGAAIGFSVSAAQENGNALGGEQVSVRLQHGASAQEQTVRLDAQGRARGVFRSAELGSNLVLARMNGKHGQALDAAEATVIPQTLAEMPEQSSDVLITTDRPAYLSNDRISVNAQIGRASGNGLLTYETPLFTQSVVTPVRGGRAGAVFDLRGSAGQVRTGALFVRDGEMCWASTPLRVMASEKDASALRLQSDSVPANGTIRLEINDARRAARTIVVRLGPTQGSGPARFDALPDLLAVGGTATQVSAQSDRWHAGVSAGGTRTASIEFGRRATTQPQDLSIVDAQTMDVTWQVLHPVSGSVLVPAPAAKGRYVLSVLEFGADGSVAALSSRITVR